MSAGGGPSVQAVRDALAAAGSPARVVVLAETARSAEDAAAALNTPLGSIVKSLVFLVGERPVMALVAGDRRCRAKALPGVLGLDGKVRRADAARVREATGFAIGGVSPVGLKGALPMAIDASLGRFETVYAAAGHPHYVFATTSAELERLTGGILSREIAEEGAPVASD